MSYLEAPSGIAPPLNHPNQKYTRPRKEAAEIISKEINAPYAEETLRRTTVPYALINGRVRYADADLRAHAESILSRALRRGKTHAKNQPPALK